MNAKMWRVMALQSIMLLSGGSGAADVCIAVSGDSPGRTLTTVDLESLGEADDLVKTGGGRLIVDFDLAATKPGWRGSVRVSEGFLRVAHVGAFGPSTAAGGVVEEGATVEFDGSVLGSSSLSCPRLSFVGDGVDGSGAVRLVGGNWSHKEMHWTLTGDATWSSGGYAETFNYGPAGSIDMGGGGGGMP